MLPFQKFNKIPRLSRDCIITEKINGTNAQIYIISAEEYYSDADNCCDNDFVAKFNLCLDEDYMMFAGSRNRWLDTSSKGDNFGFAKWVKENAEELLNLGEGRHFGEFYGKGIQGNYGLDEKRFALFNVGKWVDKYDSIRTLKNDKMNFAPSCCRVVPVLCQNNIFDTQLIDTVLKDLDKHGSYAVPGFMKPEGIVIYHKASGQLFKKTIENDEKPKGI